MAMAKAVLRAVIAVGHLVRLGQSRGVWRPLRCASSVTGSALV